MKQQKTIDKKYNPKQVESKWSEFWIKSAFSENTPDERSAYTIVIPPPNVTGILHMGHALNNTIQDILIRFKRKHGSNALWIPGTDHAGIATQNVVEKKLAKEKTTKEIIGREQFLEKIWNWKEEHGSTIIHQLKSLGASCAWGRERFTMDEGLSDAVGEVFLRLHKKGLIYKGQYIVHWCPRCKTALSDEEAEHKEIEGGLYHIKYPVKDSKEQYVVVATTRPETMLGDVAVCVHPRDKRYKALKGKTLLLPLVDREIPVIFDGKVDPEFGTGALKITPAHDPVDFEIGKRFNLTPVNVMDDRGYMNDGAGKFKGLDRFSCRKKVVEELTDKNLFIKKEPHKHAVGHCYRCDTMVEPRLSSQWFVKMKPLAEPAIEKVKNKEVVFIPGRWKKVYLNWMENIQDWCISRQIWWGHQLPVWYCTRCYPELKASAKENNSHNICRDSIPLDAHFVVSKMPPQKCEQCGSVGENIFVRDPDVLDTWFSSWLWPFSTLGWPRTENNEDLSYYYPTASLVTAPEIIFFWVARMIMAGIEFMGEAPFKDVYIHGTVRDDTGTKMSKSLGNTIDPLEVIDEFGADALRFSLISITAQGQDVFLSKEKFHIGRNFANKIWNAARFLLLHTEGVAVPSIETIQLEKMQQVDHWIIRSLQTTIASVTKSFSEYKFNEAAHTIYEFFWHTYCDWYLEIIKKDLDNQQTLAVAVEVLKKSLEILHPIMPFITEEIWQNLPGTQGTIMLQKWPDYEFKKTSNVEESFTSLIDIVSSVRNIAHQMNIPKGKAIRLEIACKDPSIFSALQICKEYIEFLLPGEVRIHQSSIKKPPSSSSVVRERYDVFVPLEGLIDLEKESARLQKEIDVTTQYIKSINAKLTNENFRKKAPKNIVDAEEIKRENSIKKLEDLEKNLKDIRETI